LPERRHRPQLNKLTERFRGRWPDEYETLPELQFWDDDKTLPCCPDGCIAIVYGEFGSHKTNTVLTMVLDAALDEGARVCYAAGEGAHGIGKQRIPAHCSARGITTKELRDRMRIVPAVPLFASEAEVNAFIEAQQDFAPNITVLDTLATVIAGEDENSSKAASFLTANGPAGRIRDVFKGLVILLAHQGKDANKKVRGHSGFMGNADVVLHVDAHKATGAIKVTVEKMRDGRDGFSTFFKVPPTGSKTVPVPEKITEEEYQQLMMGRTRGRPSDADLTFNQRRDALVDHRAVDFDHGLPEANFAEILAGPRPREDDAEALAHWKTQVERERQSLKNAHSKKSYKDVLCSQQIPTGGDKMQWRWYIVNPEAAGIEAAPEPLADPAMLFASIGHLNAIQHSAGASATGYPS
jgi:AAA domain-containing protein